MKDRDDKLTDGPGYKYIEVIKMYEGEIQYHKTQIDECLEQIKVLEPDYMPRCYDVGGICQEDNWEIIE